MALAAILSSGPAGAAACLAAEATALRRLNALYRTPAEFDDWDDLTGLPDCCSWPRVTCDARGRVELFDKPLFIEVGRIDGVVDLAILAPLTELRELDLSFNRINGFYSSTGLYGLQKIEKLHLHRNNLSDNGVIEFVRNLTSITELRIDGNQLRTTDWIANLTTLETLDMSYNHLQEMNGICHLNRLKSLKLQMNGIGDGVVGCFHNMKLQELDISNNLLTGNIGQDILNLSEIQSLQLGYNHFTGHSKVLEILDLSNNRLEGVIPESLTAFPSALSYLILSDNDLQGGVLPKDSAMFHLRHLDLENNHLTGHLPPELTMSTELLILNVNNNMLSGTIPNWLFSPTELQELRIILFKGNHLKGSVPDRWCSSRNLHILDLSYNSLSGNIPDCLSDLVGVYFSNPRKIIFNESYGPLAKQSHEDSMNITTKGTSMLYKGLPLELFIGIDFSMNNLTGNIPPNMGFVPGLKSLNLSFNHLRGTIPETFQNSLTLESLDLSYNYINGNIPSELTQLCSLSVFNVAHNNLSGEVPSEGQFPTFDKSFFEGNQDLCGQAVEKKCPASNKSFGFISGESSMKMDTMDSPIIYWSFIFGSFATGFWATIAVLVWNASLREKWFNAVDHLITC
ncbi:hypothetical protein OsI_25606 [Oryza sativa Indica Group]|uniref:Leucine-rich repeat-containing N-terminal plant-type domain-containing protein n=1 Tax=Oryza sativa subsp. indica TaxID=39946 RepID=A2YK58_ORYSI|nr:hypothetical protein OsI_25606 [Oryza sativa Indica Group]